MTDILIPDLPDYEFIIRNWAALDFLINKTLEQLLGRKRACGYNRFNNKVLALYNERLITGQHRNDLV